MDSVLRDLLHATRALRRSPGFTTIAVLTLALGIGANAAVFSILDALLLRPLPVAEANRLFFVQPRRAGEQFPSHSYPDYLDFKNGTKTLEGIAAYRIAAMGLQSGTGTERAWGYLVTGNYFQTLGVRPTLGRFFTPDEDSVAARRRELGIRIAVGAQRKDVVRFAVGRTALLLSAGSGVGLALSAAANQLLGAVMYHASSRDPFVILAAALSMAIVGLAAAWQPARRALALDPARTLREA